MKKFYIFEGCDGVGKSTAAENFAKKVNGIYTRHPGSTALGVKLRQLLKHDMSIKLDPYTAQLLFLADLDCFIETILKPGLLNNHVIADRCNLISGLAYGMADNVRPDKLLKFRQLVDMPKADILFVFWCPWEIARERMIKRDDMKCRFESKGEEYSKNVNKFYELASNTNSVEHKYISDLANKIVPIDASKSMEEVADQVNSYI